MSEKLAEDRMTLLQLSAAHSTGERVDNGYEQEDSDKEAGVKALRLIAQTHPAQAVELALIMAKHMPSFQWMSDVVVPYATDIPDDNTDLLRHATACIAGTAIAVEVDMFCPPEAIQCLAQLLKKLLRTPGQESEVRALADHVLSQCRQVNQTAEDGTSFIERFAPIIPFGTFVAAAGLTARAVKLFGRELGQ